MIYRTGEEAKVRYRTDRCFHTGAGWFIATREGGDIGPFVTRQAAEQSVPHYVELMIHNAAPTELARPQG